MIREWRNGKGFGGGELFYQQVVNIVDNLLQAVCGYLSGCAGALAYQ
jgi:hypothetical protein